MKNLPNETVDSVAEIVVVNSEAARVSPLLSRLPGCLFIASATLYFLSSEGIRNYAGFLRDALAKIMEHVK